MERERGERRGERVVYARSVIRLLLYGNYLDAYIGDGYRTRQRY